ncbi:hypothetical protein N9N67_04115 [Bacteriovoracaceae bacterium]|nr:hypothetical protein [Bacteriovoracaceae bacterium]
MKTLIQALQNKYTLQLYKSGIYYLEKDGMPLFDYTKLLLNGEKEILTEYLSYRFSSIDQSLALSEIESIVSQIIKSYETFLEHQSSNDLQEQFPTDPFLPTFLLLTQGGDDRSVLDLNAYTNKYNTSTLPRCDVSRSSCTSSTISTEAYLHIEQFHFQLMVNYIKQEINPSVLFQQQTQEVLSYFLGPASENLAQMALTPSGTDIEYLCTWLGVMRSFEIYPEQYIKKVKVIVNGDLEVGSGTKMACGLKSFNDITPLRSKINKGEDLDNRKDISIEVESFSARDENANIIPQADSEQKIIQLIDQSIKDNYIVVFHYVHASKTGVSIPGFSITEKLKKRYGQKFICIVDAAQMRIKSESVESYLNNDMNLIVTGSKFIGGPPFAGALLICDKDYRSFLESRITPPESFKQFFDNQIYQNLFQEVMPSNWNNWGLYLRWEAALFEMRRFDQIPNEFQEELIKAWRNQLIQNLKNKGYFKIIDLLDQVHLPADESSLSQSNSVITFEVEREGKNLGKPSLSKIHSLMSQSFKNDNLICEIGQPVQVSIGENPRFALRIALGAKNVVNAYNRIESAKFDESLVYLLKDDRLLINKLCNIIDSLED